MKEQTVQLNSGQRMPLLGLGTYALQGRVAEEAILQAVDLGYRLFDTAQMYANEKEVGRALRACGLSRQDLFVTSKIYRPDLSCARARAAIERSLDRLQMDYLDLMLIHEPYAEAEEMYQALEEAFQAGKIRSIGVSNFSVARFTKFLSGCSIVPAVNQVEVHVFYQQGGCTACLPGRTFTCRPGVRSLRAGRNWPAMRCSGTLPNDTAGRPARWLCASLWSRAFP